MHKRFRRDVFCRDAPALDDGERRERLSAMRYALTRPADLVEFETRTPAGRLRFETEAAHAIVAALCDRPRLLSDIATIGIALEDLLADLLALCCAGMVRPVALADADVGRLNRAILGRLGSPEQIEFQALSCGTAVEVDPAIMAALRDGSAPSDSDHARWLHYLTAHTAA